MSVFAEPGPDGRHDRVSQRCGRNAQAGEVCVALSRALCRARHRRRRDGHAGAEVAVRDVLRGFTPSSEGQQIAGNPAHASPRRQRTKTPATSSVKLPRTQRQPAPSLI